MMAKASLRSSVQTLKRSVSVFDEEGALVRTDTPDATYLWKVSYNGTDYQINADIPLPCIPAVDPENLGEQVGTITKIGIPRGEVRYGPAPIFEGHVTAWVQAIEGE
jgi:hypothetical protein